jgi:hypothetical protein
MRLRLPLALAGVLLVAGFGGSARTSKPLYGLVWRSNESMALVRLDPLSLATKVGPSLSLGDRYRAWSFSPDRSKLVFGDTSRGELLLVDARRMRRIALVESLQSAIVVATSWPAADRLYAITESVTQTDDYNTSCCGPAQLVTVDPDAHTILATRPLGGQVYGLAHVAGELVLLRGPVNAIGPARIAVVGRDGGVRSFPLDDVTVGQEPFTTEGAVEHFAQPGFAVAPDGSRAYVVTPDRVFEVDLGTGAASSHPLAFGRSLAKVEKGTPEGSWRTATWVRPGILGVTGFDDHVSVGADGHAKVDAAPAGAALVDTGDWSVRVVDADATYATIGSGAILVTGFGRVVTIYGLDGARRAHLYGRQIVGVLALGRRAFVETQAGYYSIVSLRTGTIIRKVRGELPEPLLGAGADS